MSVMSNPLKMILFMKEICIFIFYFTFKLYCSFSVKGNRKFKFIKKLEKFEDMMINYYRGYKLSLITIDQLSWSKPPSNHFSKYYISFTIKILCNKLKNIFNSFEKSAPKNESGVWLCYIIVSMKTNVKKFVASEN